VEHPTGSRVTSETRTESPRSSGTGRRRRVLERRPARRLRGWLALPSTSRGRPLGELPPELSAKTSAALEGQTRARARRPEAARTATGPARMLRVENSRGGGRAIVRENLRHVPPGLRVRAAVSASELNRRGIEPPRGKRRAGGGWMASAASWRANSGTLATSGSSPSEKREWKKASGDAQAHAAPTRGANADTVRQERPGVGHYRPRRDLGPSASHSSRSMPRTTGRPPTSAPSRIRRATAS